VKERTDILDKLLSVRLTRRQACRVSGLLGLSLSTFGPFWRKAFAKEERKSFKGKLRMNLPSPMPDGNMSVAEAIKQRRTIRSFMNRALSLQQFSKILWAAQGITERGGFKRAAPSGGALYPADVYAVVGNKGVADLTPGVYRYDCSDHSTEKIVDGDRRTEVADASVKQMWMATAPVLFVVTVQYSRITTKYGDRGIRYALIEVGHIGQNIFLQCQASGLAAGIVGAFHDNKVARVINAPRNHEPLVIMPVGWKA
jgi:SagB-type dehydrogenase family enzyme